VRWAAGEEFDTSPKRIKTPACAARGAVLVCSVCVSLSLSPPSSFLQRSPSLSPLRAGATAPSLSIPRLLQGRRVSNSAHSSGARERKQLGGREPAAAVHDRLLVGCRSTGAPPPGEACLPWFSDPGGNLALQAKEPVFPSGSCPPFPVSCSAYALVRLVIAGGFSHVDAPGQEEEEVVPFGRLREPSEFRIASSARRWIRWCDRFVQEIPAKRSVALPPFQLCSVYGTTLGGCLMICLCGVFYPLLRFPLYKLVQKILLFLEQIRICYHFYER
jgi:hypothetical protein